MNGKAACMDEVMYKANEERTEFKIYRDTSLLSMDGQIYAGILVDRVHSD